MIDDEFEWDDEKAAENIRDHAVMFETAREVFDDPFASDQPDEREDYGEHRYGVVGMAQGQLLYVAYTMRDARIRIISARKAEPFERRKYHEEED
jgi:uncharacterized protein